MTQPRRLLQNMSHATTRRARGRRFLLRPTSFVADVTRYCVALAADRYRDRLSLYAYTAQANHTHGNLKDLHAKGELSALPDFKRDLHRNVACALNDHYGELENLWSTGSYANVELHTDTSVVGQLLYLWLQPVKDGLCERPEDWPGFMLLPEDFGKIIVARRPDGAYFGTRPRVSEGAPIRTSLPRVVAFRVGVPPGYEGWPLAQVRAFFRALLELALEDLHAERERQGLHGYLGVEQVLAQSHLDTPSTAPSGGSINPRIACAGNTELLRAVLRGLGVWRGTYRRAYENLCAGRPAHFPPGTHGRHRFPRAVPLPLDPPDP